MGVDGSIERSEELERLTRRFLQLLVDGDVQALEGAVSDDPSVLLLGTDDDEWWAGKEAVLAVIAAQVQQAPGPSFAAGIEVTELSAWSAGGLGWSVARADVTSVMGAMVPMRITIVYHLEGVHWRVVHVHSSAGQRNEELWGFAFSTTADVIAAAVDAERPDLSPISASDGTLTIVFTDLEASTEMAERLGDAEWLRLLRWHEGHVRDQAARFRGQIVKSEGDGFMLAFPTASGALDFARAVQALTSEGFEDESVRMRVGINAGDVIKERDDFFGHAVTVAARVVSKARGGETLVTEPLSSLVAGVTRFRFSDPLVTPLKGLQGEYRLRALLHPA